MNVDKEFDLLKDYIRYRMHYFELHGFDSVKALIKVYRKTGYILSGLGIKLLTLEEFRKFKEDWL